MQFKTFEKLASERGLNAVCLNGGYHWQLRGGPVGIVNYYPTTGRLYVGKSQKAFDFRTPRQAIEACFEAPRGMKGLRSRQWAKSVKRRLLAVANPVCLWCEVPLTRQTATIDHIKPLSRGGLDDESNVCLACEPCNKRHGNSLPSEREAKAE